MDEELREAERKWKAFYEGKPYIIKQLGEITGKELGNGWEIAEESKKISDTGTWQTQTTWGNPNAATKAAKRYLRRMKYDSLSPIRIIHIGNYKFQPRVLPYSQEQKTRRAKP